MGVRLFLARHGETDWNAQWRIQGRTDIALNAAGEAQARQLADRLWADGARPERIYVSPLIRARRTADIVAERFGAPVEEVPALAEIHFGAWEGLTWAEAEAGYPDDWANWKRDALRCPIGRGESVREVLDRFIPALQAIARATTGDVLAVSHGGCIAALYARMNGTPYADMFAAHVLKNATAACLTGEELMKL